MSDMQLYVMTKHEIGSWWPQMRPMVENCIHKAYHGEMTADDALALVQADKAFAICGLDGGRVVITSLFEPVEYPRLKTVSCILIASDTPGVMRRIDAEWMDRVRAYFKGLGMDAMDCMASDSMSRILQRMQYRKLYNFFRMEL